jgi:predicted mannosyl-3-phosphoglycerate phosphatase (HAD superfamily)
LRRASTILYLTVDPLIPSTGRPITGFDEFLAKMEHAGIPVVWISNRTRLQLDDPRRKVGHQHPFIAEGGCGVYLPEGYFHLRPAKSVRLGRFMCIPIAQQQPAAAEALGDAAQAAGVEVVSLRSLSPRELAQNSGLPPREADLLRHRDFDELFFLAGASPEDVDRLRIEAQTRKLRLRQDGAIWSAAVEASIQQCVRELTKLYDRALRHHSVSVAAATNAESADLFAACERRILLTEASIRHTTGVESTAETRRAAEEISLRDVELWTKLAQRLS